MRLSAATDAGAEARVRLVLTIEDDGAGISADDRARVLGRGVRADEEVPGRGLGLAMVQDAVELYGGRLTIDASPLGGARVTLWLPGRSGATVNSIPWASGSARLQLTVFVWRRM